MTSPLRRVLVVGGSSGIGRSLAVALGRRGHPLAVAARRADALAATVAQAGPTATGLVGDAGDADRCRTLVEDAVTALGGIDAVVFAAGTSPLGALADSSAKEWQEVLSVNVVGAALVVSAALDQLRAGRDPICVLLTSHSVGRPWPGLVPYAASKAALDQLVYGLRTEEPWLRVVRVVVGPTATSFADGWDPGTAGTYFDRWAREGYLDHRVLEPDDVAARVLAVLDGSDPSDEVDAVG
jgi:NAD(P)-dependent dehydrogenase (short-subunit alcohol dehydrogenase family)